MALCTHRDIQISEILYIDIFFKNVYIYINFYTRVPPVNAESPEPYNQPTPPTDLESHERER
jgi:hypothetical protein